MIGSTHSRVTWSSDVATNRFVRPVSGHLAFGSSPKISLNPLSWACQSGRRGSGTAMGTIIISKVTRSRDWGPVYWKGPCGPVFYFFQPFLMPASFISLCTALKVNSKRQL